MTFELHGTGRNGKAIFEVGIGIDILSRPFRKLIELPRIDYSIVAIGPLVTIESRHHSAMPDDARASDFVLLTLCDNGRHPECVLDMPVSIDVSVDTLQSETCDH